MSKRWRIQFLQLAAGLLLAAYSLSVKAGEPIRLTTKPEGTNRLEISISPVKPDCIYSVLARTNRPGAIWLPLTGLIGDSNQTMSVQLDLGQLPPLPGLKGFSLATLPHWTLVAGCGGDSDGDGLPDIYEDLVTHTDPFDGDTGNWGIEDSYKDFDGDNWSNQQEGSNGSDPLEWDQPAAPVNVQARTSTNGVTVLTWTHMGATLPQYFVIERAIRRLLPPQDRMLPGQPPVRRRPYNMRQPQYETSPSIEFARVPAKAGQSEYHFFDTNAYRLNVNEPLFRVRAQYDPPKHARPTQVSEHAIRGTTRKVLAQVTTNGYELKVERPVPYARYLLLCRPRGGKQWIAAGYFVSSTNDAPILLHAQANGLLPGPLQRPMAMPEVKFVPANLDLEFTAGSGEDSDGDGLPDIYEALVTHTEPDNPDTGSTGILDGYKDLDGDGWSNLEEFRRRTDPLIPNRPPLPSELTRPQFREAAIAVSRSTTDLRWQPLFEIRKAGETDYKELTQPLQMLYLPMTSPQTNRPDFDLRITWRVPEDTPPVQHSGGP